MGSIVSVELNKLRFWAWHGLHKEEAVLGNEFEVNLTLTYTAPEKIIASIDDTVNYVSVYEIIKEGMNEAQALLETCAMKTAERLQQQFPQIIKISINIKKLNPPIAGFSGSVGVTYTKEF